MPTQPPLFTPGHPVYFGGSRSPALAAPHAAAIAQAVYAAAVACCPVHVGCQFGVDALVIKSALAAGAPLVIFCVAGSLSSAPAHVRAAAAVGASVHLAAGGSSAPIPARFLLRSLAAAAGSQCALFFVPGAGSLAVIRRLSCPVIVLAGAGPSQPSLF